MLEDVDPFLGDTVRGPDGTLARVDGIGSSPGPNGLNSTRTHHVNAERTDGTRVTWREGDVDVVLVNEEVPIHSRVGRNEPRTAR